MNDFNLAVFTGIYSPYFQLLFLVVVLTGVFLISRMSETTVIAWGIYLFFGWMAINFLLTFFANSYWYFLLHWFLSALGFLAFWYLCIYLSEKFGRPYTGDGAMVMLLPVYFVPVFLLVSIGIKGILVLLR